MEVLQYGNPIVYQHSTVVSVSVSLEQRSSGTAGGTFKDFAVSRDGFPKLITEQPTETSLRQEVILYYFAKSTILALLSGH